MGVKKIGFVGPFCDNNFGDFGMLVNDVYDCQVYNIVIFSYDRNVMKSIIDMYFAQEYQVKECFVDILEDTDLQTGKTYNVVYDDYAESPFEILYEVQNLPEIVKMIGTLDRLVVTGGGWINDVWCAKHRKRRLHSIMAPILLAAKMGVQIVYMGNTFGPFLKSREVFLSFFADTISKSILASRDDLNSILNLKSLGISKIFSLPDDLYFMNKELFNRKCSMDVERYVSTNNYVVIENYTSISELEKHIEEIKNFVFSMKSKYQCRVLFLPLGDKYGGAYQGKLLKEYVPDLDVYNLKENMVSDMIDVETLIQKADFVLCQRYHMFVRCIANNVPVKQVLKDVCGNKNYYYTKGQGVLRKIFTGMLINEELFFGLDYWKSLEDMQMNFDKYREQFNQMYRNKLKVKNERIQMKIRKNYIDMVLEREEI